MKHINLPILFILVLSGALAAGYKETVQADGPVAWWRFGDYMYKDGFAVEEATGNIPDSTFQGDAMTVEAGIDGKCGWFNGNKAGIDIGNTLGQLLDQSAAVTFEAWIRCSVLPVTGSTQRIFATRIDGGKAGIDIGVYTPNDAESCIRIAARSCAADPYLSASAPFSTTEKWVHLVCVIDYAQKKIQIYLDGVLAKEANVDFVKNAYEYGKAAQAGQIGRTPEFKAAYRGYLDEVAVYNKALSLSRIKAHYTAGKPQEPASLWISQIAFNDSRMVHSPSIYKYKNGSILTAYDCKGNTYIMLSRDNGLSWTSRGTITGFRMGTLFELNDTVYLLGISRNPGHICIVKTTDYGSTWSDSKIIVEGKQPGVYGYHTGPVPVVTANGRVYRVFEERVTTERWPMAYAAMVLSADIKSDLMQPESWIKSNAIKFEPSWVEQSWQCTSPGWLEGNIVLAPDNQLLVLMRVHTSPVVDKAAILSLTADGKLLSYDPQTGIIDMPGGMHKFDIHRDRVTGKYLTLNNNNTDISRTAQRNTLSLVGSDDLRNWYHIRTILQDNSPMKWRDSLLNIGFQYVVWQFDGDDIIFASRTAYEGAPNYHDSNRITFHRLKNYLDFVDIKGD